MTTPALSLILFTALGQAPGPIVPTVAHPDLPSEFAKAALAQGATGDAVAQACTFLGEGVPLCFRVEANGRREWFSLAQAQAWGLDLKALQNAVLLDPEKNPFVEKKVEGGGHWWQVEAPDGRESLVFLHPEWLSVVGEKAVIASPASGVVIAWQSGDTDNDKIMAVGVRALFDQSDAPVSAKIFTHTTKGWVVWGEIRLETEEAPPARTR
jgi:hypothetical protein